MERREGSDQNRAIRILVVSIGGRGTVVRNVVTPIQQIWSTYLSSGLYFAGSTQGNNGHSMGGYYTSGSVEILSVSSNPNACQPQGSGLGYLGPITTYIRWTNFDGTQTILTDTKYNGQPLDSDLTDCSQLASYQYANRGRVFRSTDGTDLTFVSNVDITDNQAAGFPNGVLITRDGTKYTFNSTDSYVKQIEDRNGNQITFNFQSTSSGGIYTVTDPAGRATTITFTEDLAHNDQDVITYPGFNGTTHPVSVNYSLLQNALAPGESLQTYHCLFPELSGASSSTAYNPYVVSSVLLPDGTAYTVQYNSYAEVARLTLPTGGVYTYRYAEAGCSANNGSGVIALQSSSGYRILRRLSERDEYADGSHLSAKIVFSASSGNADTLHPLRPTTAVTADFEDASGNILREEVHYFYGDPASNAPNPATPAQFADWWLGLEFKTTIGPSGQPSRTIQNVYQQRPVATGEPDWFGDPQADQAPPHDLQLCQTNTSLETGPSSGAIFGYDAYNNQTDRYEYHYGAAPAIGASCQAAPATYARHTSLQYLTANSLGDYTTPTVNILDKPAVTTVMDAGGTLVAKTTYEYDGNPVSNAPGVVGHDNTNYAGGGLRGNLTKLSRCVNAPTCDAWATSQFWYDIAGNTVKTVDPNNNTTTFGYTDSQNTYAHATSVQNAAGQVTSAGYDYNTGKVTSVVDQNNVTTSYAYSDALDRLTQIRRAVGTGIESQTNVTYPGPTEVDTYNDQKTKGDKALRTQTLYDGLGRESESRQYGPESPYISTTKTYDALGRVATTSNPSVPGDGLNFITSYHYDELGRIKSVQTADGANVTAMYAGNVTTVADQAGKQRSMTLDALGRMTQVTEDPSGLNYGTTYTYDALDDLTSVTQGSQTRSFQYDGRGLLIKATNPESGIVCYGTGSSCTGGYDGNGNLLSRTDARGVTTTYKYDALNRIKTATYTNDPNNTPGVTYSYDDPAVANSKGHLTSVTNANSTTNYTSFDELGNIKTSTQVSGGKTYLFTYNYNLASSLTDETYPSGRKITTGYDAANRPETTTGLFNTQATNYITETKYWPHGGIYYFTRGNGVWYAAAYNSRLQPVESYESVGNSASGFIALSCWNWGTQRPPDALIYNVCPAFDSAQNNGNLLGKAEYAGGPAAATALTGFGQSFSYDGVNRLTGVSDSGYTRSFGYDQWGNMWVSGYSVLAPGGNAPTANVYSNNRINGASYDMAGNQSVVNGNSVVYDAENHQVSVTEPPGLGGSTESYLYDGSGQRVQKSGPGGTTTYVYDAFGRLTAEYSSATSSAPCTTCYLSYDHLGSMRMVTDQNGNVMARHDFLPFGEEIPANTAGRSSQFGPGADNISQKFTGQIRDQETGTDYFNARYFGAAIGRFTSVDPANAGADLANPQSWNAYAYVLGNPLGYVDPSGMDSVDSPIPVSCPGCTVTVNGGPTDAVGINPFVYCQIFPSLCGGGFGVGSGPLFSITHTEQGPTPRPASNQPQTFGGPPKTGTCASGAGSNSGSAWSEMFSALGSWLTSGPKYIHYGPSDPYTKDFVKSNAMLYVNNSISGSQASSGRVAVGTGRAFLFTVLDALAGSPSVSEAQFGAFVASYSRSESGTEITISNDISNNSALYHLPSGLSMSGSYADRFGRLTGHVPTGAVLQEMTIRQCP